LRSGELKVPTYAIRRPRALVPATLLIPASNPLAPAIKADAFKNERRENARALMADKLFYNPPLTPARYRKPLQ
jgi:hypothetical protein